MNIVRFERVSTDIKTVSHVLLSDGWHTVKLDSFRVGDCEFRSGAEGRGSCEPLWFEFLCEHDFLCGPVESILSLRRVCR
jgi:hypothetical protein